MTDQTLRKLSRAELLEMLIDEGKENLRLREKLAETERELEEAEKRLNERAVTIANAGSLAEAVLQLNGVFAAADRAAEQYLENLRPACEQNSGER